MIKNKLTSAPPVNVDPLNLRGSVWSDGDGDLYILTMMNSKHEYSLVSLQTGNRYHDPVPEGRILGNIKDANFTRVYGTVTIELTP